jgi:pyrroline-5-carboxylate reductase
MTSPLPEIAILGAGMLGEAMIRGLLNEADAVEGQIRATCRSAPRRAELKRIPLVDAHSLEEEPTANLDAVADARVVIVAVEPGMVVAVLEEVASSLAPGSIVVSVAAGVPLAAVERVLPDHVAVFRANPNVATGLNKGVTGIAAADGVSPEQTRIALSVFEQLGLVLPVTDDKVDVISSISGSGAAYVSFLIDSFARAVIKFGFSRSDALTAVVGTFEGCLAILESTKSDPAVLAKEIATPGGRRPARCASWSRRGPRTCSST